MNYANGSSEKLSFSIPMTEREFLVSCIRLGKIITKDFDIYPSSLEDIVNSYDIYQETYDDCLSLGIMTDEETIVFLQSNMSWTKQDEDRIKEWNKKIEDLKVEIFESHFKTKLVESLSKKIDNLKNSVEFLLVKKSNMLANSCESLSEAERKKWLLKKATKVKNNKFNIEENFNDILYAYNDSFLPEESIRFLARNEPWRSFWSIASRQNIPCVKIYEDCEMTYNQKNLIMWSKSYDNIQESMDCPPDKVLNYDYALDGWIIKQNRKHERDKALGDIDKKLGKNNKGDTVMVMVDPEDKDAIDAIYSLNSPAARQVIKERNEYVEKHGYTPFHQLPDQQRKQQIDSNKKYMDHFNQRR